MLAVLALLLGAASSNPLSWQEEIIRNFDDIDHLSAFRNWQKHFDKEYGDLDEEAHRFMVFMDNWRTINEHNMAGQWNYTMGMN